jgi:hypothetical protein
MPQPPPWQAAVPFVGPAAVQQRFTGETPATTPVKSLTRSHL